MKNRTIPTTYIDLINKSLLLMITILVVYAFSTHVIVNKMFYTLCWLCLSNLIFLEARKVESSYTTPLNHKCTEISEKRICVGKQTLC